MSLSLTDPAYACPPALNPTLGLPPTTWCVCRTLPQRERELARFILRSHPYIPYLLPQLQIRHATGTSAIQKTSTRLLFPGIIFIGASTNITAAPPFPPSRLRSSPESGPPSPAEHARAVLDPTLDIIVRSRHASGFLHTALQQRLYQELSLLASERYAPTPSAPLADGQAVRVSEGPFMGLEGFIDTATANRPTPAHLAVARFYVRLRMLGQDISVDLPRDHLEVLP